jgi:hypothetical protein
VQDGTIECQIKLTGILSTSVLSPGEATPTHGTMVAPLVNAAAHQHLFSARLDMAVDDEEGGRQLVVAEVSGCGRERVRRCRWLAAGRGSVRRAAGSWWWQWWVGERGRGCWLGLVQYAGV